MEKWNIKGHVLEYLDDTHTYLCDGVILPSITQILKIKFDNKYDGVSEEILEIAAEKGTHVHSVIENYYKSGVENTDSKELRNIKFLQKKYQFDVLDNEVPIILFVDNKPVAGGRLDLVLKMDNERGLGDVKRTAVLDKEYLGYQLNLYRIGYQQCYDKEIKFLKGLHLRDDKRKFANIPIREELAMKLINEFLKGNR